MWDAAKRMAYETGCAIDEHDSEKCMIYSAMGAQRTGMAARFRLDQGLWPHDVQTQRRDQHVGKDRCGQDDEQQHAEAPHQDQCTGVA